MRCFAGGLPRDSITGSDVPLAMSFQANMTKALEKCNLIQQTAVEETTLLGEDNLPTINSKSQMSAERMIQRGSLIAQIF